MRDALTAAREWQVRPLAMLGSALAGDDWSEADRWLALALTMHDADKCPGGCGHYLDETIDVDGWFEAHDDLVCDACASRDRLRAEREKPEPGSMIYVEDTRPTGDVAIPR